MYLKTPHVFAVNESHTGNAVQRIALRSTQIAGALIPFTLGKVRGWLFQPLVGNDAILIVPPKTQADSVPSHHTLTVRAQVPDPAAALVDLSAGEWLRHPSLASGRAQNNVNDYQNVLASWAAAFSYVEEDAHAGVIGLRQPQLGAVHAVHAHWSTSQAPAIVVMPTGTGKTETMLSILVSARCARVLVLVPTDALRTQIATKFLTLGVLKQQGANLLSQGAQHPCVCSLRHIPATVAEVEDLFSPAHVVVATSSIAASCLPEVRRAMAALCTELFVDEAHHAAARTWNEFKNQFSGKRVLQFTATPFREDGRVLDGKIIYTYPLRKAQAEGYFKPIRFVNVVEFDPNQADEAVAAKAVEQLRADFRLGHILMARVDGVQRAKEVFKIYQRLAPDLGPVELHTGVKSSRARNEARELLLGGGARIVVCVDMLGEGFDLPELKIAAFHDIRKTLAVTLQLAGRFTRARADLGNATFIANTADISVRDELRKLYARDPDWNALLPELSDSAISDQESLQEFLRGFTDFVDEIPLRTVRPALSTVVYRTACDEWTPEEIRCGIPNIGACEQVHTALNEREHTAIVVTARRVALPWSDAECLFSWEWELYVVFWWRERKLLFINGSTNAGEFKSLAQAVAGQGATLIKGQDVFRSFAGVTRLQLRNVGLTEQLGRNISFTSRMGADVASDLADAQRRKAQKSILSGGGYENGERATVGASRKGRIWSHRRDRVDQLVEWCRQVGTKLLDCSIDPDDVLKGTLEPSIVTTRPKGLPIAVDWPEEIYASSEAPWSVSIDGTSYHLSEVDLEVADPTQLGPIKFAIAAEGARAEFELEIFRVGETSDFRFLLRGDLPVRIMRPDSAIEASAFFSENPVRIWFADGASLDGNEHTPLKSDLPPYNIDKIRADWDWAGIDLRKESQGEAKASDSIQAAVIARLKTGNYNLVFDDDGAGEAADVVAVTIVGGLDAPRELAVEFYHCKYSKKAKAGGRIDDLYVVCGQAQTSIRWMASADKRTDLFTHLLRREARRLARGGSTRIELGDRALLETLREMSRTTRVTLKVVVVQPGVSKTAVTEPQLHLLSVTENYLLETYQLPFSAVTSA